MMESRDFYWIFLARDDEELRSSGALRPVFERLDASFLPKPTTLRVPGRRDTSVDGWLDGKIGKAIDGGSESIVLVAPGIEADLALTASRSNLSLFFRPGPPPDEVRRLFIDLCELVAPDYARAGLNNKGQEIHDRAYAANPRTFYADGLYWLNYFGPDEEARQGGAALIANPHARVQRLRHGLLIEVGDSAMDMLTPDGEARLIDATRAMPPPATPEPEPREPGEPADATTRDPADDTREPAPISTVGGVRGYLDPRDRSFWVSKHIDPPHQLDKATLKKLADLPGKRNPPIAHVDVLFSTEEAARANKKTLRAIGAGAWFVSLEDGRPRPA